MGVEDPAVKARVDEGEPPLPRLTGEQRRERIDELAEKVAYKELKKIQDAHRESHFLSKHGAQTTLGSQLERVKTGKNPSTGEIEVYKKGRKKGEPVLPTAATRFISHRDQLNAIQRAQLIFRRSGLRDSREPIDLGRKIGEGYKREGLEYGEQTKAIVILNENGIPITSYTEFK
jgi:hypothetical protein